MSGRSQNLVWRTVAWLFLLGYLLINLIPVGWLIDTSIKTDADAVAFPPVVFPAQLTLSAFDLALNQFQILANIRNSLIITGGTTACCALLGVVAAYGFSRFAFPGRQFLIVLVIATRMVAPIAMVIPFLVLARDLELFNSKMILVIANTALNLPFVIWMMKGFFDSIPTELDEAARIDGCSHLEALWRVVLPVALPGLAATMILVFVFTWNEFLFAWALTSNLAAEPLTVALKDFIGEQVTSWPLFSAAGVLAIIPAVVFAAIFQRYIVAGLGAGGVKG